MNTLKTIATATLVLAAGLGLTACTASPTPPPTVTGAATTTATPTATPTEGTTDEGTTDLVEPAQPATGDIVTAIPENLADTQRAYPLADGTFAIIDHNEPLPAVVVQTMTAQVDAAVVYTGSMTEGGMNLATTTARDAASQIGYAANKTVVVVYRSQGIAEGCNGTGVNPWTFTGATGTCTAFASAADAAAAAQARIDAGGKAAVSQIIIDQG